jgi:hypothetical protein
MWNDVFNSYYILDIPPFSFNINIQFSANITGPWSEPTTIYEIPPPWNNLESVFCYAPKSHPELASSPSELIITFMSNTYDIRKLKKNPAIYIPQVLRVSVVSKPK